MNNELEIVLTGVEPAAAALCGGIICDCDSDSDKEGGAMDEGLLMGFGDESAPMVFELLPGDAGKAGRLSWPL